jgi:hypothetical protein
VFPVRATNGQESEAQDLKFRIPLRASPDRQGLKTKKARGVQIPDSELEPTSRSFCWSAKLSYGASMVEQIQTILSQVRILPRRLSLLTPGVRATVPMLRGVWGAALHDLAPEAYCSVFLGRGAAHERVPKFVLRPAPPSAEDYPALEWILIGDGLNYDAALLRAWDIASGMGLGPTRRRFHIRACGLLDPAGNLLSATRESSGWPLHQAVWPLAGAPDSTLCRLRFPAPLRLLRVHRLIEQPTLTDIVVATLRRLDVFLASPAREAFARMKPALVEQARRRPAESWHGGRLDLLRYSGRQKTELEMRGVSGYLDLPDGPGPLWPLLAAAQWLHVGKGAVVGMGQLVVDPRG